MPVESRAQQFTNPDYYHTGISAPYFMPLRFFRQPLKSQGILAGPVTIRPHLGVAQVFNDNAFATKTDRKSDMATMVAPGIQAYWPFKEGQSLLLDYRANKRYYYRFSENDAFNQEAVGHLNLAFPGGLHFNLQGGHVTGFDARGSDLDIQARDLTTWNNNFVFGRAEFLGSRTGAQLTFRSITWNFENNEQDIPRNRTENQVFLNAFYKATRKAYAVLSFGITTNTFEFNKQLDSTAFTLSTGFRLPVTDQMTGELLVGVTQLNFNRAPLEEQPDDPRLSPGGDSQRQMFVQGFFTWTPTSRLSVAFRPFRSIAQAAVFDASVFTRTGGFLSSRYKLTERWGLLGIGQFALNEFSGGTSRTDHLFQARAGVEYRTIRWLGFRLQYHFQGRSSDVDRFNFYSNGLMLTVQALL